MQRASALQDHAGSESSASDLGGQLLLAHEVGGLAVALHVLCLMLHVTDLVGAVRQHQHSAASVVAVDAVGAGGQALHVVESLVDLVEHGAALLAVLLDQGGRAGFEFRDHHAAVAARRPPAQALLVQDHHRAPRAGRRMRRRQSGQSRADHDKVGVAGGCGEFRQWRGDLLLPQASFGVGVRQQGSHCSTVSPALGCGQSAGVTRCGQPRWDPPQPATLVSCPTTSPAQPSAWLSVKVGWFVAISCGTWG